MKKIICFILILSILLMATVPSFAVGESLAVTGLGSLATSLGFSSVLPVIGIVAALVAGGVIITSQVLIPLVRQYAQHYNSDQLENLTAIGSGEAVAVSESVSSAVALTINDITATSGVETSIGITNNVSFSFTPAPYATNATNYSTEFYRTNIPGVIAFPFSTASRYGNAYYGVLIYSTVSQEAWYWRTSHRSTEPDPVTFNIGTISEGTFAHFMTLQSEVASADTVYFTPLTSAGGPTPSLISVLESLGLSWVSGHIDVSSGDGKVLITLSPASNAMTTATTFGSSSYTPVTQDTPLAVGTVISVPQDWSYDDNEDVFTVPNVESLTPGLVVPSVPGAGVLDWDASPEWQDDSPDLPDWTYKIPLLGTLVRFLAWIGSLIKTLGEWLASIWDIITGFFADVIDFFADFGTFTTNLLDLLRGSDLGRFLSSVLGFLSGYTLYQGLFTAYLPQCIAVVLWAGWLVILAFWILRMVLNR